MVILVLSVLVVLAVAGCACVVWASRGGAPRWVRGVASATLVAGELVSKSKRGQKGSGNSGAADG
ncbi:hypothetical protein AB0O01_31705 [Streptomyces sp. NPDC093252]|uniref:hypothetical protein n=1 Tax=Streptomyces sp. NPDC093252 TaxID=3154980 RepID=UPI00344970AA